MIGCQRQSKRLKQAGNFLVAMGPRGSSEWQCWVIEGRTDEETIKTHKWQEVSTDKEDFIGAREQRGTEGNFVQRETVTSTSKQREQPHFSPSSLSLRQLGNMKRPQDYSSPDSDTDEFIDVGQEDSFWWASWSKLQLSWDKNRNKRDQMLCCVTHFTLRIIPVKF